MTKRLRILALGLMIVVLLATLSGCSVDGVKDKIMGIIGPYLPGCQHEGGEATCTTQAVCEKCGVAYGNVLGHDIVVDAAVAPDCENAGLTEGKHCSRCDYTSGREVVDALGHNVVVDAAVPATCYSTGLTEGKHCDRCEEVLVAQTETTMIPHTYDEEGFDETCNAEGCTYVRTCAHDGEKTVVAGKAPTCTVAGLTDGEKCAICGDVTKAQEVIDALGHDMAEATCTAPATCKRGCGHTVGTSKGHSYDNGVVTTAPTCTEKGVKTYTCSACGDSYTEEVAAAGHSHQPKVTAPTCTEDGYITYTCSCGDSYTAPGQASTGHAWGEWVTDVEPTEESEGAKHRDCANCDEVETAVIPELSHVHSYTETVVAPTCTEKGYTKHTCRCGDTYNTDEVDALGHDEKTVTVDPTCTEAGSTTTTCTRCDYTNVTPIPATNHTYVSVVTAPKCEEEGYTTHTCHCGESYVDSKVPALQHKDDDRNHACDNGCNVYQGTHADGDDADHLCDHGCGATLSEHSYSSEVTAPTCTVDGYTTYTCACGDTYTSDVVAAKGHSYSSEVTAPTCTVDGYTTYTCACGDTYTSDVVAAKGHSYSSEVTTPAGCESTGVKTYTCQNDASHTYEEPVDATGHTEPNADGLCDNCDKPLTNEAILKALFALESGKSLAGKYTLTGVITKIDTAYSSQYKNITVTIVVDGLTEYPVQCYRMKGTGADAIKVGDTITVTGTLKNYNGTKEYDSGCTLDKYTEGHTCVGKYACSESCVYCGVTITPTEAHNYDEFGVCQCGAAKHTHVDADLDFNCDVEGCDETVYPKAGTKLTVAQAIALGKLYSDNQYTTGEYVISGTVTKIHEAWNTQYNNMSVYITDETGSILVYRLKAQVGVGDKITVTGKVGTYGTTQQVKEATGVIDEAHVCSDYTEATCEKLAECKVCGATTGELAEHTYGDDNICDVCGNPKGVDTITVTKTNSEIAGIAGVTMGQNTGVISNKNIALDSYISVVCSKGKASSDPCIYSDSVRLYQAGATITISASAGANLDTIVINCGAQYGNDLLTVSGGTISRNGSVLTIVVNDDATSVTITTGGSNKNTDRLYITSVEVSYTVESHVCEDNVENVAEVPATCDKAGTTAGTKCSKCGTVLSGCEEIKALGHDWNDWTVTKEAECGVAGEETRTCKNDSTHKETKAVAALVHNYVNGECEYCGEAENQGGDAPAKETFTADFSTVISTSTSYIKSTTSSGWIATNCAVFKGGTSDSSPAFKMIGNESNRAFCMNGKTTAKGTIVSPTLSGGISKLTFSYGLPFGDTKIKFTVNIKQNDKVVATKTITNTSASKLTEYEFVWDLEAEGVAVKGDFTIEIANDSPSNSTSNKDRTAIWDLVWINNP